MATTERIDLPTLSPGTERHIQVRRYGRPGARPKVYIQASVHADEMPGVFCVHHLTPLLEAADRDGAVIGEIVVVPFANPIGLAQDLSGHHYGRFDLASRENFNRGYPWLGPRIFERIGGDLGTNAETNVALIRRTALACLAETRATTEFDHLRVALMTNAVDADLCFDLHSAGEATLYMYCDSDPGGDALATLAAQMAAHATFVQGDMAEARTFAASVGQIWRTVAGLVDDPARPVPTACLSATIELRGGRAIDDAVTAADARNLFGFLQRQGVVAGDPGALPALLYAPQPIAACDHGYAPSTGILVFHKAIGDTVAAGETVAVIVDPAEPDFAAARTAVASGAAGLLFDRQGDRFARAGDCIFRIAADGPLAHREGLSPLDD